MTPKQRKRIQNRTYGSARHKRAGLEARAFVMSGFARSARCGEPIKPGDPFDVGHDDATRISTAEPNIPAVTGVAARRGCDLDADSGQCERDLSVVLGERQEPSRRPRSVRLDPALP